MVPEIFESFWQNLTEISPPIFWAGLVFLAGILISRWIGILAITFLI